MKENPTNRWYPAFLEYWDNRLPRSVTKRSTMCDAYVKIEYAKHNMSNKIGVWDIEFPVSINGSLSSRTAFVRDNYKSDFVTLYGGGKIGISSGLRGIGNKKVIAYLEKLSLNLIE